MEMGFEQVMGCQEEVAYDREVGCDEEVDI